MTLKTLLVVLGMVILTACSTNFTAGPSQRPVPLADLPSMRVDTINVTVPQTLVTSEANSIKPKADIVWRGDPLGDRYGQVKKIVEDGLAAGAKQINGDVPVIVNVTITRFHALTERTRYTFGGEQELEYILQVVDARSGAELIPAYPVNITFPGYGGEVALVAERSGNTQKVRIMKRFEGSIIEELTGVVAPPVP